MNNHIELKKALPVSVETLVGVLRRRASTQPETVVYTHLVDGESEAIHLTFGELWLRTVAVAEMLRARGLAGERVLLLYPPGLDYAPALFGCFLAGVIAVPEGPPEPRHPERSMSRIRAVVANARAAAVLTVEALLEVRAHLPEELAGIAWLATDTIGVADGTWPDECPSEDALAYLQYTSGSTADPKGVMVTHRQLAANCRDIEDVHCMSPESIMVCWVPTFHDLGLLYGIALPVWSGFRGVSLAAADFVRHPVRWLRAIHRYRGTHSVGPDTAYAITAVRVQPEERQGLDLSSWHIALNGGEPVRAVSERAFVQAFASCGFRAETFSHSLGMSEATAMVTGERPGSRMQFLRLDPDALARDEVRLALGEGRRAIEVPSCGTPPNGTTLRIVDPGTRRPLPPNRIGEVWLRGPAVGLGYFEAPELSAEIFEARTEDGEGPWLRTGDQGFLHEDRLFLTGRIKDIVIVRGANHYPQDLETSILGTHPALRPGRTAAFSVNGEAGEQLVIVCEVRPDRVSEPESIYGAIRAALAEHGVRPSTIALIQPATLPHTTSGKLQRRKTRQMLLDGALEIVHRWDEQTPATGGAAEALSALGSATVSALLETVRREAAKVLGRKLEEVPSDRPLIELGFDSAAFAWLAASLEKAVGRRISPTLFFDHPSPRQIALHVSAEDRAGQPRDTATMREEPSLARDPIVITSMACRLPGGVGSPEALWALLDEGRDAITAFPNDRSWDTAGLFDPDPKAPGRSSTMRGGFVDDIALFDAAFFHISPREAHAMDPQQRTLLELAWEAIERAGIDPSRLQGSDTGVFVGLMHSDYEQHVPSARTAIDAHPVMGSTRGVASGRIAYTLGLEGPAMTIDTACSSSLVAVHQAVVALERGECTLALAGGATLFTTPDMFIWFSRMGALAPDGRSKAFSASANGTGCSEGAGLLLLTRLSEARRRDLPVLAVVRGSAVNQDGRTQGLSAPNGPSQQRLIRKALTTAGLDTGDIDAIEAHGTGTALGDPIEAGALLATYGQRPADRPLKLGSIKSNIGHPQAAAGIAGLMKMVLALQHARLPKTLHITSRSPHVDWTRGAIELLTEATEWPRGARTRRAAISSFGLSGTNAHVIIEEAPEGRVSTNGVEVRSPTAMPLLLSAQSETALRAQVKRLLEHLAAHPELRTVDVAATLALRRAALPVRLAARFGDFEALRRFADGGSAPGTIDLEALEEPVASLCTEWVAGGEIDWAAFFEPYHPRPVSLPTYAFQRRRYWMDARDAQPPKDEDVSMKQIQSKGEFADFIQLLRTGAASVDIQIDEIKGFRLRLGAAAERTAEKTESSPIEPLHGKSIATPVEGIIRKEPSNGTSHGTPSFTAAAVPEKPVAQVPIDGPHDLKGMLADILGIADSSELDEQTKFVDLGVDSMMGVEFVDTINRAFGLRLQDMTLYEYPTLAALSAYVANQGNSDSAVPTRTEPVSTTVPIVSSQDASSLQREELRAILSRISNGELEPQEGSDQIERIKSRARISGA